MTNAFSKPKVFLQNTIVEESCYQSMVTKLDGLVHTIITTSPRYSTTPEDLDDNKYVQAVEWAAKAWKTIWISLMGRRQKSSWLKHPLHASPAQSFIERLAERCLKEQAIPWLKFHTTYLFARYAQQTDLPVCPAFCETEKPGILGGGWVYVRCNRLMQGRNEDFGCALDILYSKYGMPKAPDSFIQKSLVEHRRVLGAVVQEPKVQAPVKSQKKVVSNTCLDVRKALKSQIDDIVGSVFANKSYQPRVCVPSQSACFELGTARGGQLEALRKGFFASQRNPSYSEFVSSALEDSELLQMKEVLPGVVKTERTAPVRQLLVDRFSLWARETAIDTSYSRLKARQFGIPEPLKVRVILEGESVPIYFVNSIQKFMHSNLKRFPAFKFIGSPDTVEDIAETFKVELKEDEEYVSGDYSAATDNLRSDVSRMVWDSICTHCKIDEVTKRIGLKCLTEHVLYKSKQDPEWKQNDPGVEQMNGQSMGSPMSFPILCIANLACWSLAYGLSGPEAVRGPVRVNGDDIVFSGKIDLYESWWKINNFAGFLPSKGKNYRSRKFVNINSHTYQLTAGNWRRLPVVNLAIIQNLIRKGPDAGHTSKAPWYMIKPAYDQLVDGFSMRIQENLRDIFSSHVRLPNLPIDLPTRCGGPGLSVSHEGVGMYSDEARMMSSLFMLTRQRDRFLRLRPCLPDNSAVGEAIKDWESSRQMKIEYKGFKQAPVSQPEDGGMCAGDVLGVLLNFERQPYGQSKSNVRSPLTGSAQRYGNHINEDVYDNPEFVRKSQAYESSLCEFYSDSRIFGRFFHLITGCVEEREGRDLSYGTANVDPVKGVCMGVPDWEGAHLADALTCDQLNLNWVKRVVTWDRHSIPEVNVTQELDEVLGVDFHVYGTY